MLQPWALGFLNCLVILISVSNFYVVYSVFSTIIFEESCEVTFHYNEASINGGTMYIDEQSNIIFERNSTVTFDDNEATRNGGAVYSVLSAINFKENCNIS